MSEILLNGLNGGTLLGYMAALGTLRVLTRAWPEDQVMMDWIQEGAWRPVLRAKRDLKKETVTDTLFTELNKMKDRPGHVLGNTITVETNQFREYCRSAIDNHDHFEVEFAACLGSDAVSTDGRVEDTAFRTMQGSGNQYFLKTLRDLTTQTTKAHLENSLFDIWQYRDKKLGLRWDSSEDRRYALRWGNPSDDETWTQRGANRLAIEALPLFPVAPVDGKLMTTGFSRIHKEVCLTWPIWKGFAELDTVTSVLSLEELQQEKPKRTWLDKLGIIQAYRVKRLTVGKFRNFTAAEPV